MLKLNFYTHFIQRKANRDHRGCAPSPASGLERYRARIQTHASLSLPNHCTTPASLRYSRKGQENCGPEKSTQDRRDEKKKKTPPGLIKCLINSRRRIGRNNEHLSESLIACKSLFPASSHLIFTAGLGGRYYHYLHFIGEERKALTPPSLSGQAVHLGGGAAGQP